MELPAFLTTFYALLMFPNGPISAQDCTTGFSVVAPELAAPGKTTAVLVTLHGPVSLQPLNVTLKLSPDPVEDKTRRTTETTSEIKGHGIVPLEIPSDSFGNYLVQTMVNCTSSADDGRDCSLQSVSQIRLVGPVRDVIVRPAKHAYKPGETISFWVLALDHNLQLASGAIGSVSVKDPLGTKVAIWDQVSLDEGVKSFSLTLSEYVRSGKWLLHVEVEATEFSTSVEVAPNAGNGLPDISAAEEHYVELRFGKEMRRRYKPGLPFTGKVEAMSTEKSVRVRVKVYDNTTSIYSQDIEISNGEGRFIVPAILADSDVITLQAELVSVESKEIESHYVLAREAIQKWNSSSDCYLLIEGVENTLLPDEEAHVAILSTCPCERDLHYVITTDGQVTDWAQRRYEYPVPDMMTTPSGAVCKLNFSFTVRSVMAPVSQLLVYYVTPQGEPVSDVISFDIKLLHRQVYVNMEEREWWLPNQAVDLEVVAEPSSLVCLLGGRSESNADFKFDPRISEDRDSTSVSGEMDFLEAGVSFFQKRCVSRGDTGLSAVSYRQRGSGAGPSNRRRPPESLVGGTAYDQLWLWRCFNYTSEIASTGVSISAPQEAGKWSLWALTVSGGGGLRFSAPVQLQVYRPLQAEFKLPPSLRVREALEVDIKIGNNINSCMDVTALLALSEGAQFLSNGLLYVTERLRLGPHGATSLVVRLLVTSPGLKNMTVEVNGYTSSSCDGSERSFNTTMTGAVIRSATVRVHPEGIVRTDTESAYFCANENLLISTADSYRYEWIPAPRNRRGIVLEIRVGNSPSRKIGPVRIALGEDQTVSDKMYRIAIGDSDNAAAWIGRGKHGYALRLNSTTLLSAPLAEGEWRTFWISWDRGRIVLGRGSRPGNDTVLVWKMDKRIKVQQLGFASSWGNLAEFRIWNFNDEAGFSQVLPLNTPLHVVPGTEWGQLEVNGGLSLPTGCVKPPRSDSLVAALASLSSLMKLERLDNEINATARFEILRDLPANIQTILSYKKPDNSFSEHQMLGSHRVTLSILEVLTKVQNYVGVDPELIQSVKRWVQSRQEDDGRFQPLGADMPIENSTSDQNLMEQAVELTAETVMVLNEIGIETDVDSETIQKAKIFLENSLPNLHNPEVIASVTLALVLTKSATSAWAVEKLRNASTTEDGEFGWPRMSQRKDAANWLFESDAEKNIKEPLQTSPNEYKASIYSLIVYSTIGDLKFAESVARYLFYRSRTLDRHPELLYIAVKSFALYDSLLKDTQRSLTISIATSGMELTDTLDLKDEGRTTLPRILHLPSLPTKVFVYATGAGCATIQGHVTYSTYATQSSTSLLDISSTVAQEVSPDKTSLDEIEGKLPLLKIETCFKWKGRTASGVLRMEVSLFSGFEPVESPPPQLVSGQETMAEMQHGYRANDIWFVFANVTTSTCPICVRYNARSPFVVSSLRPSYARIYPAGREDLAADTFFHTTQTSNLLKGITDDDFITWFGKNTTTQITDSTGKPNNKCNRSNSKRQQTTAKPEIEDEVRSQKLEALSVATYTINVDNETETNDSSTETYETTTEISEKQQMLKSNSIPETPQHEKSYMTTIIDTTQETITKTHNFLQKHVNTIIQDSPIKYLNLIKTTDEPKTLFAPKQKNDKYVLLDKEEIWSLLKEIVNNQKTPETDTKKINVTT